MINEDIKFDRDSDSYEALIHLIEECSEIIKVGSKILRFGINSRDNWKLLSEEVGNTLACINILRTSLFTHDDYINFGIKNKYEKCLIYSQISADTLEGAKNAPQLGTI